MKKILILILVLIAAAYLGAHAYNFIDAKTSSYHEVTIQQVEARPAFDTPTTLAGVAERDITTGIGIPKFGYSLMARSADGFRNRLKARAFYIKPAIGEPIAIVQTDLPSASLILHHQVAELIAQRTDINFNNLSITSTHTHNGPGAFLASNFYNKFGSNKPGLDPAVLEFLTDQIAAALIEAYNQRKPAKIAIGHKNVWGLTKNRAIDSYIRNPTVEDKSLHEMAQLKAVNPLMTMLRIDLKNDQGDYLPAGAFTSFAIHGTGIPAHQEPYHADVWAYLAREVEWNAQKHYALSNKLIHGAFEASHGDNNPAYRNGARGELETRRIGIALGREAWELFSSLDNMLTAKVDIESAMREVNLLEIDSELICERAALGTTQTGAALGDAALPLSFIYPFKAGSSRKIFTDGCHGNKLKLLSSLQSIAFNAEDFPHLMLLHLIRINDQILFNAPFELTTQAGKDIATAIKDSYNNTDTVINHVAVHSLANGYFGYSTTREEYAEQNYEGGHTIYGPGTNEFIAQNAASMAKQLQKIGTFAELPDSWSFSLVSANYSLPRPETTSIEREQLSAAEFVASRPKEEGYWSLTYADVDPGAIDLHKPLLSIETSFDGSQWNVHQKKGVAVNDEAYDLQIRYIETMEDGRGKYELRWFSPSIADYDQQFRFKINRRGKAKAFTTEAFN